MSPVNASHARSFLFVPGDRPERFAKAVASGADVAVLDLEDAVGVAHKEAARSHVGTFLRAHRAAVRINATSTPFFADDVEAISGSAPVVMLAKADAESVDHAIRHLPGIEIIALIETARGVLDAAAVARAPGVTRLALGTIDLAAELGVDPARSPLMDHARMSLAYASSAASLPGAIDGVTPAIREPETIRNDIENAARHGFTGKLCIHPDQITIAHAAMRPSEAEARWAQRIVQAADDPGNGAVFSVDGAMIDRPVVARARAIVDAMTRRPGLEET